MSLKKLDHTSLSDVSHIYFLALLLLSLSIFSLYGFILLVPFLPVAIRQVKKLVLVILLLVFLLLIVNTYKTPQHIDGKVEVVASQSNSYQYTYTVKYRFKKYQFQSNVEYQIGTVLNISAKVIKFRKQTNLFGYNEFNQKLKDNIVGKLQIEAINQLYVKTNLAQVRYKLLKLNIPIVNFLIGDETLIDNSGLDYIFRLSAVSILGFIYIIKKIMFYLNISNKKQTITLIILLALLVILSDKLAIWIVFLRMILKQADKYFRLGLSSLDVISLSGIIMLILKPYLIFNQSFWIIYAILLFYSLSIIKHPILKYYLPGLILIPFLISWDYSISLTAFILGPLFYKYLKGSFIFIVTIATIIVFLPIITIFKEITKLLLVIPNLFPLTIRIPAFYHFEWFIYFALLIFIGIATTKTKQILRMLILVLMLVVCYGYKVFNYEDYIYFLDVNQGDSTIILVNQKVVVVDAYQNVLNYLLSVGKYQIDYLILTHSDLDHTKEAQLLLDKLTVKNVILNGYDNYGIIHSNITYITSDALINLPQINLTFLGPFNDFNNSNDNSLVFTVTINNYLTLFLGDIGQKVEEQLIKRHPYLKAEFVKIAHHGASSSTAPNLIKTIKPKFAFISCGKDNYYNHPHFQTLTTLTNNYVEYRITSVSGASKIVFKNDKYQVINNHKPQ